MKRSVALTSGSGWHVQDLARAAGRLGLGFEALPFERISASLGEGSQGCVAVGAKDLAAADGVLVRMMPPGSLEQVVFRMDALERLSALGVPVLNPPRAVEIAVDKYRSLSLLERAGVAIPRSWVGQKANEALEAMERLGGDVIVKPLFGSEGRGMVRVSDPETAWRTFHTLERLAAVLYLQRPVRHPGHDYRAFVLRGEVVAAMCRRPAEGEWRSNVALGGPAEPCRLEPDAVRLAVAAARAVDAEIAGVDLMPDLDRGCLVVLEVNAVPGWRALSRVTGVDIAAAVVETLATSSRKVP
jgi:tetrahydromethanopterin:alpha-L-glutamate ligase